MSVEVFWQVPLAGDGRSVSSDGWQRGDFAAAAPGGPEGSGVRPVKNSRVFARTGEQRDGYTYYDLLLQIGRAAELAGFDGLWIPEQPGGEDPLIAAGSLAREVTRLRLVPSLRPALLSAVYATKIANSFQRLTGGRLAWNVATAYEGQGRKWHGREFSELEQIARAGEFLDVAKGFWNSAPFTYEGKYYEVVDGGFALALQGERFPEVYLSGTTEEALSLSAKHADVHFFPLAPVGEVRANVERLSRLAAEQGREVAIGLEVELLARHDASDAWAEAAREWEQASSKTVPISGAVAPRESRSFAETRSGGNLWSGFGALRPGSGLGLVGSYAEVVASIREYAAAGVSTFVLGAYPHLEEAYTIGEHVVPFIRRDGKTEVRVAP